LPLLFLSCVSAPPPTRPPLFVDGNDHEGPSVAFADLNRPGAACEVELLDANMASWVARWKALEAAEHTIESTYFIWSPDVFGLAFLGLLHQKAKEGVHIRLMVDSRGSFDVAHTLGRDLLEELVATGNVEVRIYNPIPEKVVSTIARFDTKQTLSSTHDKIILVDGKVAILGGRNIADEYMVHPKDLEEAMADLDILIRGDALAAVRKAFDEEFASDRAKQVKKDLINLKNPSTLLRVYALAMDAWLRAPAVPNPDDATDADRAEWRKELDDAVQAAFPGGVSPNEAHLLDDVAQALFAAPRLRGAYYAATRPSVLAETKVVNAHSALGEATEDLNELVIALMRSSRREIVVQNPYIVLTKRGWQVLKDVADQGVSITILTNGPTSSDSSVTSALFLKIWKDMLALSPRIRVFVFGEQGPLHAKAGVFDDEVTLIGSYNLDLLSARFNSEILAVVKSEAFAKQNREEIMRRLGEPAPAVYEYKIRREPDGSAMRYPKGHIKEGEIVVEFGPEHHTDPALLERLEAINTAMEATKLLPSFSPLL